MFRPILARLALPRLMLALGAAPLVLSAQRNNSSDVTGLGVTSSSPAGGVYVPALQRVPVPVADGGAVSAPTNARLEQTVVTLQQRLEAGAMRSLSGAQIPADQQRTLRGLFSADARVATLDVVRTSLAPMLESSQAPVLSALLTALADLGAFPSPRNVALAVDRFNAFIDSARPEALAKPEPTFAALHMALTSLANGATAAAPATGR